MTEHEAFLCLNAVSGLGNLKIQRLVEVFKTGAAVWRQSEKYLRGVSGIGAQTAANILNFDCGSFLREERRLMSDYQVHAVTFFDEEYPEYLRQTVDCPVVLYIRGDFTKIKFPGIAVVGSRRASVYGKSAARLFGSQLARRGISVISGMARGIDTAAHQGCLEACGKTAAVLGSGLAKIYPPENKPLYSKIASSGCVVSEFPMMTAPCAGNFPRRNRIISGLSAGVIVVEAAKRSGALITSRCALEQGREVFAVPGKIGQAQAAGTNMLIQQGAKLVVCIDDVLEEFPDMNRLSDVTPAPGNDRRRDLSDSEKSVLDCISDEPAYIDDILLKSGLSRHEIMPVLLKFECSGRIQRLPGNFFALRHLTL